MEEQPELVNGIKAASHIEYLGLILDNKRKYFEIQLKKMIRKAQKELANITYSVIEKSRNNIMIERTY